MAMEFILGLLLGGAGRKPEWEKFGKQVEERLGHITYFEAIIPYGAYNIGEVVKSSFAEMCYAYLFGLPNSSVSMAAKLLENCLKAKYNEVEGKSPEGVRLVELIDWAKEKFHLRRGEVGDAVRLLRNEVLHRERMAKEPEVLQTIKHMSLILNQLYPFATIQRLPSCPTCNTQKLVILNPSDAYVGHTLQTSCDRCRRVFTFNLMP